MLDCRRVTTLRLRFPDRELADLVLDPGVHAIGRDENGLPGLVDDTAHALAQFCVDRRGVWLQLRDGVRGVHVNGRPVRRMAMLRAGDTATGLPAAALLSAADAEAVVAALRASASCSSRSSSRWTRFRAVHRNSGGGARGVEIATAKVGTIEPTRRSSRAP